MTASRGYLRRQEGDPAKGGRRPHPAVPGRGHRPGRHDHQRPRGSAVLPRTEVALSFALPGSDEQIAARGVVVNDASTGGFRRTGVRFIALAPQHDRLIAGYCRSGSRHPR